MLISRPTLLLLALLLAATPLVGQNAEQPASVEEKMPAPTAIESIEISPEKPGVDTLCTLRVKLSNTAEKAISALRFEVELGGAALPVYARQLFMDALPPGATTEVELYNFWTTETGRAAPKDGKLGVVVRLAEARWVSFATEEDGTEVWTLGEPVEGLPVQAERALDLGKAAKP